MRAGIHDVIQVGYGPVSECLALMLGRQGRSVAICERWQTRYPLPRAVCIDHEIHRVLWANGMGSTMPKIAQSGPLYQWFNADWRELLVIDWSAPSISGGPEVNFVHQPTLEEGLDKAVAQLPTVDRHLGWEVVGVRQDEQLAHVDIADVKTGEKKTISARYVIGCDGANSIVREAIGGGLEDRGFEADWLVIDVLLKEGVTIEQLGIPAAGQYCNPIRPTTIVGPCFPALGVHAPARGAAAGHGGGRARLGTAATLGGSRANRARPPQDLQLPISHRQALA